YCNQRSIIIYTGIYFIWITEVIRHKCDIRFLLIISGTISEFLSMKYEEFTLRYIHLGIHTMRYIHLGRIFYHSPHMSIFYHSPHMRNSHYEVYSLRAGNHTMRNSHYEVYSLSRIFLSLTSYEVEFFYHSPHMRAGIHTMRYIHLGNHTMRNSHYEVYSLRNSHYEVDFFYHSPHIMSIA
ncbi:hypothetical protein L9F63_012217, partial [Diploptera punctata]